MTDKGIDLSNSLSISATPSIQNICAKIDPIFKLSFFNYVKIFNDQKRSTLTTRPDFIVSYYNSPELFKTEEVLKMEREEKQRIVFTEDIRNARSYVVARNDFDIDNGFTIILPTIDGTELYYFGTTKHNTKMLGVYRSNIDYFLSFINYFRETANALIVQSWSERFRLPLGNDPSIGQNNRIASININQSFHLKKFIIDHERRIFFSRREAQCVHLLSKGMSTKYIARDLQLSPRTVEHYLECAKLKLDCYEKNTLLKKIHSTGLEILLEAFCQSVK